MKTVNIEVNASDSKEDKVSAAFDALVAGGMPIEAAARISESMVSDVEERLQVLNAMQAMRRRAVRMTVLALCGWSVVFGEILGQILMRLHIL